MRVYQFNFFIRNLPPLILLLPAYVFLIGGKTGETFYILLIATAASIALCLVLARGFTFEANGKQFSVGYFFLGFCIWKYFYNTEQFDGVEVFCERVYTPRIPIPTYKGANICRLAGSTNVVIKISPSENAVKEIANKVSQITGLPVKHRGESIVFKV